MTNGENKNRGRENPTKGQVPAYKGLKKTQLEVVEVENTSICPHIRSLHYALTVERTRLEKK